MMRKYQMDHLALEDNYDKIDQNIFSTTLNDFDTADNAARF